MLAFIHSPLPWRTHCTAPHRTALMVTGGGGGISPASPNPTDFKSWQSYANAKDQGSGGDVTTGDDVTKDWGSGGDDTTTDDDVTVIITKVVGRKVGISMSYGCATLYSPVLLTFGPHPFVFWWVARETTKAGSAC